MNKIIFFLSFGILFMACANPNDPSGGQVSNEQDMLIYGRKIYENQCQLCHGEKGDAAIGGASDLRYTKLNESNIGDLVFHGKGAMPAFEEKLGEPEINAVAKYVLSLKKK